MFFFFKSRLLTFSLLAHEHIWAVSDLEIILGFSGVLVVVVAVVVVYKAAIMLL